MTSHSERNGSVSDRRSSESVLAQSTIDAHGELGDVRLDEQRAVVAGHEMNSNVRCERSPPELGLLGITYDEKYGGAGLDYWWTVAFVEAMGGSCTCMGVPLALMVQSDMCTPAIHDFGSEELKEQFLVPSIKGEMVGAIGVSEPLSVYVDLHGTGRCDEAKLETALRDVMGLSPRGIRQHLKLNTPIYERTAAYGHFGREPEADGGFSWEKTDLVDELRPLAG